MSEPTFHGTRRAVWYTAEPMLRQQWMLGNIMLHSKQSRCEYSIWLSHFRTLFITLEKVLTAEPMNGAGHPAPPLWVLLVELEDPALTRTLFLNRTRSSSTHRSAEVHPFGPFGPVLSTTCIMVVRSQICNTRWRYYSVYLNYDFLDNTEIYCRVI